MIICNYWNNYGDFSGGELWWHEHNVFTVRSVGYDIARELHMLGIAVRSV